MQFYNCFGTLTTTDGSMPPSTQVALKDSLPPKIHDFASCSSFFAVRNIYWLRQ
jgi:hypothetical protein